MSFLEGAISLSTWEKDEERFSKVEAGGLARRKESTATKHFGGKNGELS